MSSRIRSARRRPRAASASRPFSAKVTVWPSCSSARPSSRRFTRLSSTTSRSPVWALGGEVTSEISQRAGGARVVLLEPIEPLGGALEAAGPGVALELAGQRPQRDRAEALGGGLERVGGAAEGVHVHAGQGAAEGGQQLARVLAEGVDELGHERASGGRHEAVEHGAIDRAGAVSDGLGGRTGTSRCGGTRRRAATSSSIRIGLAT